MPIMIIKNTHNDFKLQFLNAWAGGTGYLGSVLVCLHRRKKERCGVAGKNEQQQMGAKALFSSLLLARLKMSEVIF